MTPSDCTRQPGTAVRSVVTAPITAPSRSRRAEWSWSSIRTSNNTESSRSNTETNHVAIESALTASAIRAEVTPSPPVSASASASSRADLRRESQQRGARRGHGAWALAPHQHLTHPLFERLDPLAHRRGCDVQRRRRRVERTRLHDGGQRRQLLTVESHIRKTNGAG